MRGWGEVVLICAGAAAVLAGAWLIHPGLALMLSGAGLLALANNPNGP